MQPFSNQTYLNRVGCSSDNDLSCFPNHPFSNLSLWVQTILYSLIIPKPSVIQKKKTSLEANALLLALATSGLACLYYLTTCCSLAGADRLAWVGKSMCIKSVYRKLCHSDSYHVEQQTGAAHGRFKKKINLGLVNGTTPQTRRHDYRQNRLAAGAEMIEFHLILDH